MILITSPFILIQLIPCSFLSFQGSDPNQKMGTEINAYDFVHTWNRFEKSLCVLFLLLYPASGAQPEVEELAPGTYQAPGGTDSK